MANEVELNLTDAQLSRVLTVSEKLNRKWQETVETIFERGINALENQLAQAAKRDAANKLAKAHESLAQLLKLNPSIAASPAELLGAMQKLGIAPATPAPAEKPAESEQTEAASA